MPEQRDQSERAHPSDNAGSSGNMQVQFDGEPPSTEKDQSLWARIRGISFGKARVPAEIITSFLRQMVMLLEAGVPLLKALNTLGSRTSNKTFADVVKDIAGRIESGNTLWQSLSYNPRHFDHLFVSIMRAGESSGTLTDIMARLSDYREKKAILRSQVRSALAYPFVIALAGLAVLILFLWIVVPEFETMFGSFDVELPIITRIALGFTHGLKSLWWLWILIIAAIVTLVVVLSQRPAGRYFLDYWKLRMPVFGQIMTKKVVADFAHTFSTLLNAGISILETLDLTKDAVGNVVFAQDLQHVRESIERGEGLEKPLRRSKVFPPLVTDMLATGEQSGSLDKISRQIAVIYEAEVETAVGTLKSLIEPIMILGLGLVVLFLTLSFFWPYVSLIEQITSM